MGAVNFAALFGEDQHVAGEDAYTRLMKCRKWVVLAAALFYLTHCTQIAPQAFSILIAKTIIPLTTLQVGTTLGLTYIMFQYMMLGLQFLENYSRIMADRLGVREAERMHRLNHELAHLRASFKPVNPTNPTDEKRIEKLSTRIEEIETALASYDASAQPGTLYISAEYMLDAARVLTPFAAASAVWIMSIRS